MKTFGRWLALYLGTVIGFACLSASRSEAQDFKLKPTYGEVTLKAGFLPDPFTQKLDAGGPIQTKLGGVSAWVANAPDFRLQYTAGNFALTITVESAADTTLLVNLPDGKWIANDDGPNTGLNPLLTFAKPQSGQYDIWVGTFANGMTPPAKLIITELGGGGPAKNPNPAQNVPDISLKPTYGEVKLNAGFLPNPFSKYVVAGGEIRTNLGGVNSHVARAPDFNLDYTKGSSPLTFRAKSVGDTTLLIKTPDGNWIADDDSGGGLDPLIRIASPMSGRYSIYVGTYQKDFVAATLYISELSAPTKPFPVKTNLPDCYVLSVGVDNYPFLNKLNGDLNDARNTVAAFKNQTGIRFRNVHEQLLLDGAATHQAIHSGFQNFTKKGTANDYFVLFLSGHGGRSNGNKTWIFCPVNFKSGQNALTDLQILDIGDQLIKQKKNVVIVVDACHSGQMHVTAQPYYQRYQTPNQGGLIMMLACTGEQTSAALGNYSTFAKAFSDAMTGEADLSKDGTITLAEMKSYTKKRTDELVAGARASKQDCIVAWSPSLSHDTPFAYTGKPVLVAARPQPTEKFTRWTGKETLPGYGKLAFTTYANGRAVMEDARSTTEGIWQKKNNQITLHFANGSIIYRGTLNGTMLSGTATSPGARDLATRTWTWTVSQ